MAAEADSSAMVRIKWIQLLRPSGVFYAGDELWCPSTRGSSVCVFPGEVGVAASAASPRDFVPLATSPRSAASSSATAAPVRIVQERLAAFGAA
jgi:hypothetical protein